jgi:hypothetical protein
LSNIPRYRGAGTGGIYEELSAHKRVIDDCSPTRGLETWISKAFGVVLTLREMVES